MLFHYIYFAKRLFPGEKACILGGIMSLLQRCAFGGSSVPPVGLFIFLGTQRGRLMRKVVAQCAFLPDFMKIATPDVTK
jgi:hypothetical protein